MEDVVSNNEYRIALIKIKLFEGNNPKLGNNWVNYIMVEVKVSNDFTTKGILWLGFQLTL